MYRPGGLIDGAVEFYEWLVSTKTPHVFLSNTGAKGSPGVQTKFKSERYRLSSKPVPLRNIWTASEAQMDLMMHKKEDTPDSAKGSQRDYGLPHGAKVFVMAGGEGFWLNSLRMKDSMRFDSWDIRTTLTNDEAKAWAKEARDSQEAGECTVFVVLFLDGKLDKVDVVDGDVSGRSADYRGDWNYGLIRNVSFLLHHGAQLIYTADDAFNPSEDPEYPGMVFPLPGPGMFAAMMKFLMAPAEDEQTACAGKGGSHGDVFMFEHAIRMLKAQGHDGDLAKICMVGDRFDTDIRGGNSCGIKACLVQSGAHLASQQARYPSDVADFTAASVGSLVPRSDDGAQDDTAQAQRGSMASSSSNWQSVRDKVPFGARRSDGPRRSSTAS